MKNFDSFEASNWILVLNYQASLIKVCDPKKSLKDHYSITGKATGHFLKFTVLIPVGNMCNITS